jgi:hypothetical protein
MKNKILSTIVISLLLVSNVFAQEQKPVRIHELGLTFANLNQFGIRYKTGNEKTLLRITALAMNLTSNNTYGIESDSTSNKNNGAGAGFRIGFEKPIVIVKNFNLLYGLDFLGGFNYQKYNDEEPYYNYQGTIWSINTGLAFVFGGTYSLGDHFRFSAELSPALQYSYGEEKRTVPGNENENRNTKSHEISFGLSNYGASLTIGYLFNK